MPKAPRFDPTVTVIGAGFGGLCIARALLDAGFTRVEILERAESLGGTWRDNTYPGAECDIPSPLYSYSFAPNPAWPNKWSHQPVILDYLTRCASELGLDSLIRFESEVTRAVYDTDNARWRLDIDTPEGRKSRDTDVLIAAVGQLSRPRIPAIGGSDNFGGDAFHSARWDHGVAIDGRRVSVIGSAASAVQIVPAIAGRVARLNVLQRSANWIIPKNDREYSAAERWIARHVPAVRWLYRLQIWLWGECMVYPTLGRNAIAKREGRRRHRRYLERTIKDPALRSALTPDYPFGAKRVLLSDNYYQALTRDNVRLITTPIRRLVEAGIELDDGEFVESDVIVFATGFKSTEFLQPIEVVGQDGQLLSEYWREGAHAHLGVMTPGFPNLFFLYGPNTNLGHNSIVFMHECQSRLIVECLRLIERRGARAIDVRPDVEAAYNRRLAERLQTKSWAEIPSSWYQLNGRQTNNWPGTTLEYWWRTRRARPDDYAFA